jgi:hypothetical protein
MVGHGLPEATTAAEDTEEPSILAVGVLWPVCLAQTSRSHSSCCWHGETKPPDLCLLLPIGAVGALGPAYAGARVPLLFQCER